MIGSIIGDIVGSVYEFKNIRRTDFEFYDKDSFFTDDTICTIALMDWILHSEVKDTKSATKYLRKWTRRYPNAGYGGRFYQWVHSIRPEPYRSYGNGAAMRISSIAWYATNDKDAKKLCNIATSITHNHPEGLKGAWVTTKCIRMALECKTKNEILKYAISEYPEIASFDYELLKQTYEFNETCQETVPQAIYCFAISENYEECIRKTISIGGDSDTLAAISGAIAEAYWGIPEYMISKFKYKLDPEMNAVIEEFYLKFVKSRNSIRFNRFIKAQNNSYTNALKEIKTGKKITHWMWFIFPQIKGLGRSENSEYFGLNGLFDASEYYNHSILGPRLIEITENLLFLEGNSIEKVLGPIDSKKLKSCMTLFYLATRSHLFKDVLNKYFGGEMDTNTVSLLIDNILN